MQVQIVEVGVIDMTVEERKREKGEIEMREKDGIERREEE
jgi:hypothetical protein